LTIPHRTCLVTLGTNYRYASAPDIDASNEANKPPRLSVISKIEEPIAESQQLFRQRWPVIRLIASWRVRWSLA
jgi:hypothetical protein